MVGLQYPSIFHNILKAGNYKSRLMVYTIDLANNPIDVSSRTQVEEYGTLLKYANSDTDSNGRISQNGIRITNYYNKDEQYTIGNAPICNIKFSLINDDGFFSTYDWTYQIVVYWDVWDETNEFWLGCPLGVYWWERPVKTSKIIVEAQAYDAMSLLDQWIDWSWPDMTDGVTLAEIYTSLVGSIPGIVAYPTPTNWANMTTTFHVEPFSVENMTRREILAKLAEIAGANAHISRDGYVMLKPFTDAYWREYAQGPQIFYTLDGDTSPTPIIKIDIGEYTVPLIDAFTAQVGQTGTVYTSGSGTNTMYSINNGFLNTAWATMRQMVDAMYGVASGQHPTSDMVAYTPISLEAFGDPSVEAGDIIRVVRNSTTYYMPVFQQELTWNGADWYVRMQNSGNSERAIPSEAARDAYVQEDRISTLEQGGGGGSSASIPASATIDGNGLITFKNSDGNALFTLQLPVYGGA